MENDVIIKVIEKLPLSSRYQVEHFIIKLINEAQRNGAKIDLSDVGGVLMATDFDEPLKEFHDYMYTMDIKFIEKIEALPIPLQNELEMIADEMLEKGYEAKPE